MMWWLGAIVVTVVVLAFVAFVGFGLVAIACALFAGAIEERDRKVSASEAATMRAQKGS